MILNGKKLEQYMSEIDRLMIIIAPVLNEVTDILERSGLDVYSIELKRGDRIGNWRWISSNYYRPPKIGSNQRMVDGIERDIL